MSQAAKALLRQETEVRHHKIFQQFRCWEGVVPEGFVVNFLGVMTDACFWTPYIQKAERYPKNQFVKTDYPDFDEEYFEWIDLLQAVTAAKGRFTMIELGAGWGRWIANAFAALKQRNDLPHTLIGVEAEPTHFRWMAAHLPYNGVDLSNCRLIDAAVAAEDGKVGFRMGGASEGGPADWYGQSIGGSTEIHSVSLNTLLRPLEKVDLIDLDVQGAEFEVLDSATEELDQKVKKVHVGTHGERLHSAVQSLFARLGWKNVHSYPSNCSRETDWGTIVFGDGLQTWDNPKYFNDSPFTASTDNQTSRLLDEIVVLQEKLKISRQEGRKLWAEVEQLRAEMTENSFSWQVLRKSRVIGNRLAPPGTLRRKMCGSIIRPFRALV